MGSNHLIFLKWAPRFINEKQFYVLGGKKNPPSYRHDINGIAIDDIDVHDIHGIHNIDIHGIHDIYINGIHDIEINDIDINDIYVALTIRLGGRRGDGFDR